MVTHAIFHQQHRANWLIPKQVNIEYFQIEFDFKYWEDDGPVESIGSNFCGSIVLLHTERGPMFWPYCHTLCEWHIHLGWFQIQFNICTYANTLINILNTYKQMEYHFFFNSKIAFHIIPKQCLKFNRHELPAGTKSYCRWWFRNGLWSIITIHR